MKKTTVINIFNFIRRSHQEPSIFIQDDFDTIKNQMEVLKQYGLPSTYALKHDALMDPMYQQLLADYIDNYDEVGVWWEITGELCSRAGVTFRGEQSDTFDNGVSSGYSIGYTQEERKALLDAYMKDFKEILGYYPKTIASWVMDSVTFQYAHEKYALIGGGLCRDQIGIDGFTLWGGYINGAFYPSKYNEIMPAQTAETQLDMPLFRLLGPDPIYNFESDYREGVAGVYSLEPSCLPGRTTEWITWMFNRLTDEDTIGMNYAQVGQENNFLWENIQPGFEKQLRHIKSLSEQGLLRIETLGETAAWFKEKYASTPPATYIASEDWNQKFNLKTMWYSSKNYRLSFIYEQDVLSIRDLFVYHENYHSRYLDHLMVGSESTFDALPIMNQIYWSEPNHKACIVLLSPDGTPILGKSIVFSSEDELTGTVTLKAANKTILFKMTEDQLIIEGDINLHISHLPVLQQILGNQLALCHNDFDYKLTLEVGSWSAKDKGVLIQNENQQIILNLCQKHHDQPIFTENYLSAPDAIDNYIPAYQKAKNNQPRLCKALPPTITPSSTVRCLGETHVFTIDPPYENCIIRYTLDGSEPTAASLCYTDPLSVTTSTTLKAKTFTSDLPPSATVESEVFFGKKILEAHSPTVFDRRAIFNTNGVNDLINSHRGSLDYQDGNWLGTLEDLDATFTLDGIQDIHKVSIGFISNHRVGLIYPKSISLYAGCDASNLTLIETTHLPNEPTIRQIEKRDFVFKTDVKAQYIRIVAENYIIQPYWCCYKGLPGAFLFADHIIIE